LENPIIGCDNTAFCTNGKNNCNLAWYLGPDQQCSGSQSFCKDNDTIITNSSLGMTCEDLASNSLCVLAGLGDGTEPLSNLCPVSCGICSAAPQSAAPVRAGPIAAPQSAAPVRAGPIAAPQSAMPIAAPQSAAPVRTGPTAAPQSAMPIAAPQSAMPIAAPQSAAPVRAGPTAAPQSAAPVCVDQNKDGICCKGTSCDDCNKDTIACDLGSCLSEEACAKIAAEKGEERIWCDDYTKYYNQNDINKGAYCCPSTSITGNEPCAGDCTYQNRPCDFGTFDPENPTTTGPLTQATCEANGGTFCPAS
jgi:hypothetical protein